LETGGTTQGTGKQTHARASGEVLAGSKVITEGGWVKVIFPAQKDYHLGHWGNTTRRYGKGGF
jgi:hypothetical protein